SSVCSFRFLACRHRPQRDLHSFPTRRSSDLYERIDRRTELMFAEGILREVQTLLDDGVPETVWPFGAVGYKQALAVVKGELDVRSEEHTSELQSRENLVCRLLLEKKKTKALD